MTDQKKILFSAVKNEAPFLLEWLAYHRAIGFDTALIVSNDSDDGTTELLDALHAAGVVHHIHHSVGPEESPQGKAARAGNASALIADGDWVMWLDPDEFLNIHLGEGLVDDLIARIGSAQGMLIPWRLFGDNGQIGPGPWRFVSPDFVTAARADDPANGQVKTLYRYHRARAILALKTPHRPALARAENFSADQFIDAAGLPVNAEDRITRNWLSGVAAPANARVTPEDFSWETAQINHYTVRTQELFLLKRFRGRGFRNKNREPGVRYTEKFYRKHNLNHEEDRTILRHQKAVDLELARLLELPRVRGAYEEGQRLSVERVALMREALRAEGELLA